MQVGIESLCTSCTATGQQVKPLTRMGGWALMLVPLVEAR
jgi:hypothetical protein